MQPEIHLGPVTLQSFGLMLGLGFVVAGLFASKYLKELDRRVRWNGGPPAVEDWGSPHLDLVATRAGYWRPVPTLIQLASAP